MRRRTLRRRNLKRRKLKRRKLKRRLHPRRVARRLQADLCGRRRRGRRLARQRGRHHQGRHRDTPRVCVHEGAGEGGGEREKRKSSERWGGVCVPLSLDPLIVCVHHPSTTGRARSPAVRLLQHGLPHPGRVRRGLRLPQRAGGPGHPGRDQGLHRVADHSPAKGRREEREGNVSQPPPAAPLPLAPPPPRSRPAPSPSLSPTQVFAKAEFLGGADILMAMHNAGELEAALTGVEKKEGGDGHVHGPGCKH